MYYDWNNAVRIGRCADQICGAIDHIVPLRRLDLTGLHFLYDLSGCVDEIPRLAVLFSTSI